MGSRFRKALVAESVRDSLHSWCKRVKERSKRDSAALSVATRSVCSLDTTIDEQDEITVASGTLSRSSSLGSLNEVTVAPPHEQEEAEEDAETSNPHQDHHHLSLRIEEYLNDTTLQPPPIIDEEDDDLGDEEGSRAETLIELFQRTWLFFRQLCSWKLHRPKLCYCSSMSLTNVSLYCQNMEEFLCSY